MAWYVSFSILILFKAIINIRKKGKEMEDPGISAEMQCFLQTCRKWEISEKNFSLASTRNSTKKNYHLFLFFFCYVREMFGSKGRYTKLYPKLIRNCLQLALCSLDGMFTCAKFWLLTIVVVKRCSQIDFPLKSLEIPRQQRWLSPRDQMQAFEYQKWKSILRFKNVLFNI